MKFEKNNSIRITHELLHVNQNFDFSTFVWKRKNHGSLRQIFLQSRKQVKKGILLKLKFFCPWVLLFFVTGLEQYFLALGSNICVKESILLQWIRINPLSLLIQFLEIHVSLLHLIHNLWWFMSDQINYSSW